MINKMINIEIRMVDGTKYNVRNIADSVKGFHKMVIAPYGTNMSFVEIIKGELIFVDNIISIREMDEDEFVKATEPEEVVGLRETEIEIEEAEKSATEKLKQIEKPIVA